MADSSRRWDSGRPPEYIRLETKRIFEYIMAKCLFLLVPLRSTIRKGDTQAELLK